MLLLGSHAAGKTLHFVHVPAATTLFRSTAQAVGSVDITGFYQYWLLDLLQLFLLF